MRLGWSRYDDNKEIWTTKNLLKNQEVLLPAMGLEPIRGCPQQILSLPRLPFRHAGVCHFLTTKIILAHVKEKCKRFF